MKTTPAFLYRQRGAIGAASHWSRKSIGDSDRFEFLGLGIWFAGRDGMFLDAPIAFCLDIEEIKS